jgi:hypothetical protein
VRAENKKGRFSPPPIAPKQTTLTQTSLIRDQIIDRITLIGAEFLNGSGIVPAADNEWNEKNTCKKCCKCPSLHGWPSGSVDADETF